MTALLFCIQNDGIYLAMDTLCRSSDSPGRAHNLCTKIVFLPHMQALVCGTGVRDLIYDWARFIQEHGTYRDLVELDAIAPDVLRDLAARYPLDAELSCTLYNFGLSRREDRFLGFVYRSKSDFISEPLRHGVGAKPPDGLDLNDLRQIPDDFIRFMIQQKALDESRLPEDQVGIGGEIQFAYINRSEMSIRTCASFIDLAKQIEQACGNP